MREKRHVCGVWVCMCIVCVCVCDYESDCDCDCASMLTSGLSSEAICVLAKILPSTNIRKLDLSSMPPFFVLEDRTFLFVSE